ncbi:hypothetical protein ACK2M7_06915 [Chryseobacterium sp. TY4]
MKTRTLLDLRKEIIDCKDESRLLELEINLKYFNNLQEAKSEQTEDYSEEEIKDIKNSIALAVSYLRVIEWKKQMLQIEKETNKINAIVDGKNIMLDMFKISIDSFLVNNYSAGDLRIRNNELKKEIAELKKQISNLTK